ncbi:MAG: hypothetical protein GX596_08975 [Propionibacterium sp.]|nr:hypothetical protein [Propionibacterium sp.]
MSDTWWGERFIAVLEGVGLGGRLQRGKTYARKGQVLSLEIDAGLVSAVVQGSRVRPYRVRIGAAAFGKAEWAAVEEELAGNAWYLARLLAGEMPEDIEDVFARLGLELFPAGAGDLSMDCSCPDWEVPCKHLAAAFYLLAESFDDDPFRILAWRGRTREDLLANLTAASAVDGDPDEDEPGDVPLEDVLDSFFALQGELPRPGQPAAADLLGQVPEVGVTVRGRPLVDLLAPAYRLPAVQ